MESVFQRCLLRAFVFLLSFLHFLHPPGLTPSCAFSSLNSLHLTSLGDICSFPPLFYASSLSLSSSPPSLFHPLIIPSYLPLRFIFPLFLRFYLFFSTWMLTIAFFTALIS